MARASHLISSRGGLMSKGDLYLNVMRYRKVRLLSNNSHIKLDKTHKRNEIIMYKMHIDMVRTICKLNCNDLKLFLIDI